MELPSFTCVMSCVGAVAFVDRNIRRLSPGVGSPKKYRKLNPLAFNMAKREKKE